MRFVLAGLGIVVVAIAAYVLFFRAPHYTNYPPHAGPVVAFGDSLVAGTGSTQGKDFVSLLSKRIGEPIENFGVPGDTAAMALQRIDAVIERHPRMVLLLVGGNDYLRRIPSKETFSTIRLIIKKLQADGAVVVVLGVRGGILVDNFAQEYKTVAQETKSVYVSDVLHDLLGNKQFMSDQVHPNDAGYVVIAERVFEAIRPVLK